MDKETWDALLGQQSADATVRDALLIALLEVIPGLHGLLESKVAVAVPVMRSQIPAASQQAFDTRIHEVLTLIREAAT